MRKLGKYPMKNKEDLENNRENERLGLRFQEILKIHPYFWFPKFYCETPHILFPTLTFR